MRQLLLGVSKIVQIGQTESRSCMWILREARFVRSKKNIETEKSHKNAIFLHL